MAVGPVSRNDATAWFFDGTDRGQFLLLRCDHGHVNQPQSKLCPVCSSTELVPFPASGRVRLVSWVVVHDRPREGRPPRPPVIPAIVEFEEGPWWWAQLSGADPAQLRRDMELRMTFERPDGGEAVPVFHPAAG